MDDVEKQALVDLLFTSTTRDAVIGMISTFLAEAGTEDELLRLADQLAGYEQHRYAAGVVKEIVG